MTTLSLFTGDLITYRDRSLACWTGREFASTGSELRAMATGTMAPHRLQYKEDVADEHHLSIGLEALTDNRDRSFNHHEAGLWNFVDAK